MDFEFGPDGALYLIEWGTGFGGNNDDSGIYRIDYIAGDRAPIAAASANTDLGAGAADCALLQRRLPGPGRRHAHLRLDFGDGQTSTEANPTHTYATAGNFTAQLTVTNPKGRTAVANVPITVGNTAPTVTIEFPPDGGFFNWGDQVRYTVKVTDPEDGQIDCAGCSCRCCWVTTSTPTRWSSTPAAPAPSRRRSPPGTAPRRTSSRSSRPPTPTRVAPAAPAR